MGFRSDNLASVLGGISGLLIAFVVTYLVKLYVASRRKESPFSETSMPFHLLLRSALGIIFGGFLGFIVGFIVGALVGEFYGPLTGSMAGGLGGVIGGVLGSLVRVKKN